MLRGRGAPVEAPNWRPNYIVVIAVGVAAAYVLRAWISSRITP
jgi:hypothetical protein